MQLSGGITFDYGFELKVPTKSSIRVDLGSLKKSSLIGFPGTTISALPFEANVADIELSIQAAFRPRIPFGFSFLDDIVDVGVGVYLDMPSINTTITQLATSAVNATCDTAPGKNTTFESAFKDLTHIESDISFAVGVDAKAVAKVGIIKNQEAYTSLPLFETSRPLATACLAFGEKPGGGKGLVTATATTTVVAQSTGAAGEMASNPLSFVYDGRRGWFGAWEGCLAVLMVVAAAFTAL
jgi:hypothetical protein